MCSEATLPGSNLATFEINDNFHGVTERHAYRRVYDDRIDLTFYVDADELVIPIKYFETWMKYVVEKARLREEEN
jgi:pantothenate kinase